MTQKATPEKQKMSAISEAAHYLTICLCQSELVLNLFVWWFLLLQGLLTVTMISVGQSKPFFHCRYSGLTITTHRIIK